MQIEFRDSMVIPQRWTAERSIHLTLTTLMVGSVSVVIGVLIPAPDGSIMIPRRLPIPS